MSAHSELLAFMSTTLDRAFERYGEIQAFEPERLPAAQIMLDDTVRAYNLVEASQRLTKRSETELRALLVRAKLMSDALGAPIQ